MFFYIPALITILIQLVHVVFVTTKTGVLAYTVYDNTGIFQSIILAARGLFLWAAAYATNFRFLGHAALAQLAGLSLFALLLYFGIKSYQNHTVSAKVLCLFIIFNLIAIMFGCITSLSHWSGIANIALKNEPFRFGRRWFVSYDMVYLAVVILLFNLINAQTGAKDVDAKRGSKIYTAVLAIFLILSVITTAPKIFDKDLYIAKGNRLSLSDWTKLHILLNNGRYYIPLDPFPFGLYAGIKKGTAVGQISDNIYAPRHQFANTIDGGVPHYDRSSFTSEGDLLTENLFQNGQKIMALIAAYPKNESIYALALDAQDQVLARSYLLSSSHTIYKYLLFDQSVSAAKIRFLNQDDKPVGTEITLAAVYIEHQEEN